MNYLELERGIFENFYSYRKLKIRKNLLKSKTYLKFVVII